MGTIKEIITLDEAVRIAKERDERNDTYQEYEDAYFFYQEDGEEMTGGDDGSIIVMKKNGTLKMPYQYFLGGGNCKEIGEPVKIKDGE